MKTISVKEAAEALGVSPRAIQYKLQNGDLKGNRTKNQYGVQEWRVWPTKEISEALKQKGVGATESGEDRNLDFEPDEADTVDAESYAATPESESVEARSWLGAERETIRVIAEEMVKPLVETIKAQTAALTEKDRVIEEQSRQLRLLPDFQKQAEDERQAAELKALETEALHKQIAALEEDRKAEKAQVEALTQEMARIQQPWWKKWFTAPAEQGT